METSLIYSIIVEPAEMLTRNVHSITIAFLKCLISTIIAVPVLQKMDPTLLFSDSILFAATFFMKTHNWKKSILVLITDAIAFGIIYHFVLFKSVFLVTYLCTAEIKFKYTVNYFLTKCLYFLLMSAFMVPRDIIMVMGISAVVYRYIYEYGRKCVEDGFLFLGLIACACFYFDSKAHACSALTLCVGVVYWIISKAKYLGH